MICKSIIKLSNQPFVDKIPRLQKPARHQHKKQQRWEQLDWSSENWWWQKEEH